MCQHQPRCPDWAAPDRAAALVMASQPQQGWSLLCNSVVLFDDGGQLLPDGKAVLPVAGRACRSSLSGRLAMAA